MTARHPRAIVLGADTPIGLTVIRELGAHGVPVHAVGRSRHAIGRSSRWTQSFSERPDAPVDAWLPGLIRQTGAGALLAISEEDLIALAALDPLIDGCRILTPRQTQLAIVLDKSETLARAAALGIDVPDSWQPHAGEDFAARAAALTYPVVVKWADPPAILPHLVGHDLRFVKADHIIDAAALIAVLARYAVLGRWPLVQSYCPGTGLGQMFHMKNGVTTLSFQHRRVHEWPPEGGVSTVCASVPLDQHREQRALSESLLNSIGWDGPAMVEYRYDATNRRYQLMEINGRFWGSLPLARHSGAEFAWETYAQAFAIRTAPSVQRERHARYTIPETRRLMRVLFAQDTVADRGFRLTPWHDLLSYFTDLLDPGMRYFVFDWKDPMPFFSDMAGVIRKVLRPETPSPDA